MKNKSLCVLTFCFSFFISNQLFSKDIINAAEEGNFTRLKELVAQGADINTQNRYWQTPLHITIENKHYQIAEFLIKKGANLNIKDNFGLTPLNVAAIEAKYITQQKTHSTKNLIFFNNFKKYKFYYKDITLIKLLVYKQIEQNKTELIDELAKACDLPLKICDPPRVNLPEEKISHLKNLLDTVTKCMELDTATQQFIKIIKSEKPIKKRRNPADDLLKLLANHPKTETEIPRELKIKALFSLLEHIGASRYTISSAVVLRFPEIMPETMGQYSDIYSKIQAIKTILNIAKESDTSYKPTHQVKSIKKIIKLAKHNEQYKKINRNIINLLTILHWCHGSSKRKISPDILAYTLSFSDGGISNKLLIDNKRKIQLKKLKRKAKKLFGKKKSES